MVADAAKDTGRLIRSPNTLDIRHAGRGTAVAVEDAAAQLEAVEVMEATTLDTDSTLSQRSSRSNITTTRFLQINSTRMRHTTDTKARI